MPALSASVILKRRSAGNGAYPPTSLGAGVTIEEDFEQVRECLIGIYGKDPHAALDRIEGYIEQCADFQHVAEKERDALKVKLADLRADARLALDECEVERDALKLELDAEKFNHRKDNEHLVEERDALKAAYEAHELLATEEVRNSGPKTEAALKRLFAARQAIAQLEEK